MILGTPKMTSTKTNLDFSLTLNDTLQESVEYTLFLGVLIDECLTWINRIDYKSKTISRNIGIIDKLKCSIPGRILKIVYRTLI